MKLQFEANQEYQLTAINAVVDIFDSQPATSNDISMGGQTTLDIQGRQLTLEDSVTRSNQLLIDELVITNNVHAVQQKNNLEESPVKVFQQAEYRQPYDTGAVYGPVEPTLLDSSNFTVEMETGTGKTYVYLRTIHELHAKYGFKKFIIVVPSLAIKEGVLKNLKITKEHFAGLYGNPEMDYYVWDAKKRGLARQFATNDTLQILVTTIDSFARSGAIMRQTSDYGTPLNYIKATNPIVILDEPQNMETDIRKQAIADLNPLCTLRYSATHKNYYNLLYRLDPVAAYDKGLVKKIEVDSIYNENSFNAAYISLIKIERSGKSGLIAHVEVDKDDERGLQRKVVKLRPGDDLQALTGRSIYEGFILDAIDAEEETIEFANGQVFYKGHKNENLLEDIMKYQIERTVENHFEKEKRFAGHGIKVLSLFFIDKVANYREYTDSGSAKGKFAIWFEEAYRRVAAKPKFAGLTTYDVEKVHNGYFSADKKGGEWKDTRGETAADVDTYELIMRDKERLLDNNEPLRFIFSHSALREGWDNPNVFQICTLNETSSEIKKRQEIGRGLRLPVNAQGARVRDENINVLTVIANESYDDFSRKLQTEIEEETGVSFSGRIKNKVNRRRVLLTKNIQLDPVFKELWNRIKHKTSYSVEFNSEVLIAYAAKLLQDVNIAQPRITSTKTRITSMGKGMASDIKGSDYYKADTAQTIHVPDVLTRIQRRTKLTRKSIYDVLHAASMFEKILINPEQVIDEVSKAINQAMQSQMVDGVKYEKTGQQWDMRLFENTELERYLYDAATKTGAVRTQNPEKTVYDYVDVDSEVEYNFMHQLETDDNVSFYIKLPGWFKIDTPLGGYNPDWAIVLVNDERIYFVAETKGSSDINDIGLRESERGRIRAGKRHFDTLGVKFVGPTDTLTDAIHKL